MGNLCGWTGNLTSTKLQGLGIEKTERFAGRLILQGTLEQAYRICMWSRLASRVLKPIHTFELEHTHDARDVAEELYEGAISFDWSLIFAPQSTFAIRLHVEREIKVNSQFATLRVKTAWLIPLWKQLGDVRASIPNNQKLPCLFWQVKPNIPTASIFQATPA